MLPHDPESRGDASKLETGDLVKTAAKTRLVKFVKLHLVDFFIEHDFILNSLVVYDVDLFFDG